MKAQKCPVCEGKGKMPADFYPDTAETTEKWVTCRTCNGSGIVVLEDEVEHIMQKLEESLSEVPENIEEDEAEIEAAIGEAEESARQEYMEELEKKEKEEEG